MGKNPLVSVIITTKNEGARIEKLLLSLKKQTYGRIEVVVVDNNSSDDTKQISKKYTRKVYNLGPERSVQRNFGVSRAKGEFVLILDADMELTPKVVESCVANMGDNAALIVPEKTVGNSLIARVRAFERRMYMGDPTIEVARFFRRSIFLEYGGYDVELTGPEDYDLPYRISKDHDIGYAKEYILHREQDLTLSRLLRKKYYYAFSGAKYARKHPELVASQGLIIFRKAYVKHWKSFLKSPVTAVAFVCVRIMETAAGVFGFIRAVGVKEFILTLRRVILAENSTK